MSDDSPILTNQQRLLSIKLRMKAEQQARDAAARYDRSLQAINRQYRKDMIRSGLEVLLEGKQNENV